MNKTPLIPGLDPSSCAVLQGDSNAVRQLRLGINRMAPHFRFALLTGEAGTCKQAIAREMHRLGPVSTEPFVAASAAAFAGGAVADAGMFFLRGCEAVPHSMQQQLLSRLNSLPRNARVVFASTSDLRSAVSSGRMLPALHARVATLEIKLAPLRERVEDLPRIINAMFTCLQAEGRFDEDAWQTMRAYRWPGNFKELAEVVRGAAASDRILGVDDLRLSARSLDSSKDAIRLDEVIERHVVQVLERCGGNKLKAAEMLGISRSTLYRMLDAAAA